MLFEEIMFSARVASWTRFSTLLGSLWAALWPPRWLKTVLKFFLSRPRADQEHSFWVRNCLELFLGPKRCRSRAFFFGPGGPQERSKRPPRGKRPPEQILDTPKWPPGAILGASGRQLARQRVPEASGGDFGRHF